MTETTPTEAPLTNAAKIAQKIAEYRKAVAAFVTPVIVGVIAALSTDGRIDLGEWLLIATIALGSPLVVGVTPANKAKAE